MPWSRRSLVLTLTIAAASPAGLLAVSTAASAKSTRRPNPAVEVGTAHIAKLGTVLVRGSGHALYMFAPYPGAKAICSRTCEKIWQPLYAPETGVAKAIGSAKQSLIGSVRDPANGRRVVTYDGWPLYTYVLDKRADQANGQNIALNGGYWWVLTPAGKINRTPVSHGDINVGS